MGRVAVDFGVGQGTKRSADISSDLGQASNAVPLEKSEPTIVEVQGE